MFPDEQDERFLQEELEPMTIRWVPRLALYRCLLSDPLRRQTSHVLGMPCGCLDCTVRGLLLCGLSSFA